MLVSEDIAKVTEREREILAREYPLPNRPTDPDLDLYLLRDMYATDPIQPRNFTLITGTIRLGIPPNPDGVEPDAHQAALSRAVLDRIGAFWDIPDLADHPLVAVDVLEQMMTTRVLRQVHSVVVRDDDDAETLVARAVADDLRAFATELNRLADYLDL